MQIKTLKNQKIFGVPKNRDFFRRGEIYLANLEPIKGSEQGGIRPVLVIQNDISNQNSPVTIIAAITSKVFNKEFPTNVFITKKESKLNKDSHAINFK